MYYVYILQSKKNNKKYVGFTSRDVRTRLEEHNLGKNVWTSQNKPFNIVYYEELCCEKCARKRERFWKSGLGRKLSDKIINDTIEESER